MRCKACGRVLPDGSKKCPHCGMIVPVGSGRPGEEFKWNIQEYPRPEEKKKVDVSIDWQSGQIVDRGTGRTYSQTAGTGWSEPEKARELFTFEKENEVLQKELDRKVDTIAEASPKERIELQDRRDIFSLPSQMDMNSFDDLINDEPEEPAGNMSWGLGFHDARSTETVQKREEPVYRPAPSAAEFIFGGRAKKNEPILDWSLTPGTVGAETRAAAAEAAAAAAEAARRAQQAAAEAAAKKQAEEVPPPARAAADGKYSVPKMMQEQQYDPFEDKKNWEQVHMPEFLKGGSRLIFTEPEVDLYEEVTEAAAKDIGPSAGYMADAEEARAQETFQRLISVEQRFSEDMDRVVFMSEEEKALEAEAERKRVEINEVPQISYLTIEDEYDRYCTANGIPKAKPIEETEKAAEAEKAKEEKQEPAEEAKTDTAAEQPREVNIKIKDDSTGTQYTVKTQDTPADKAAESAEEGTVGRQTRTVQVSVEMDGAGGSSSVEVTSGADGSTVVTTTDGGQAASSQEAPAAEAEEDVPFWERKKPVSRMTITDIFGPEAREILNKPDEEAEESAASEDEAGNTRRIGEGGAAADAAEEEIADAIEETAEEAADLTDSAEVQAEESSVPEEADAVEEPTAEEAEAEAEAAAEEQEAAQPESGEEPSVEPATVEESVEEPEEAAPEEMISGAEAAEEPADETEAETEAETAEEQAVPVDASEEPETLPEEAAEPAEETAEAEDTDATPAESEDSEEPAEKLEKTTEVPAVDAEESAEAPEEAAAAADAEAEEEAKVEEFVYTVDEDRMTKQEIREMSEEELEAAQKAAAVAEKARAESVKTAAEKTGASDIAAKTEEPVESKPEKERKFFRKAAKEKDEEPAYKELDEDKIDKRAAKAERIARKKAEEEEESSMSLRIMKIVIIVLIVAVALEFLIFGIKLLAPDSLFGVLISKIESGITGSVIGNGRWLL